jgi:endonuclease YncB( thermonuclease family)
MKTMHQAAQPPGRSLVENLLQYAFLTVILTLFLSTNSYSADSFTGQVVGISDGDTITVQNSNNEKVKIRLAGIDCPESFQVHGEAAKQFISSIVSGKRVRIEPETIDQYGRTVGMVLVNGKNINEQLVAQGHGWVFRKYCTADYCKEWLNLEEKARKAQAGLWQDANPQPPWEWRAEQKGRSAGESSSVSAGAVAASPAVAAGGSSIVYHGNRRSQVFHGPGCKDYNCKNCTVILNSKGEAVSGGYRPHRECVQ